MYTFSHVASGGVLGTGMRYDIAAVAGEQMHVVAKIDKRALAMLKRR